MDVRSKFSVKMLRMIYLNLGIFFDPVNQKYLIALALPWFVFFALLTLYFEISAYVLIDDVLFRAEAVALILFYVIFSLAVVFTLLERDRWILFYTSVQSVLVDDNLNDHFEALLVTNKRYPIFLLLLCANFEIVFPIINICTTDVELGSYKTLILPTVYPWRADTPFLYTMTLIFQICSGSFLMICTLGTMAFVYYFFMLITSMNAALKKKIIRLDTSSDKSRTKMKNSSNGVYRDQDVGHLRSIIRNHQNLTRLGNQYKELVAPLTHLSIISFFIGGVFIVSAILFVENNFLHRLKLMNLQMGMCYLLIGFCLVGQTFDEMNVQVLHLMYEINWFEKSPFFRKEMMMFMTFLQKQQPIKIFRFKVLNWAFVTTIVRVTYSALQVFISTQR